MPGIRLHPNYHGYSLKDRLFSEVLELAAKRRLVVQLACAMEDERTQHALVRVPPVDLSPLPDLLKGVPGARLMILNSDPGRNAGLWQRLPGAGNVWFDIAMVEGVGGVARLAARTSIERVVFGSNYPLFYLESAVLKVRESGLQAAEERALVEENARGLQGP
jgi:hypothetical protein